MEAAEQSRPNRWEGESSGSEVDPDDLLTEEERGLHTIYVYVFTVFVTFCLIIFRAQNEVPRVEKKPLRRIPCCEEATRPEKRWTNSFCTILLYMYITLQARQERERWAWGG